MLLKTSLALSIASHPCFAQVTGVAAPSSCWNKCVHILHTLATH